jgi:hypothetical protein
MSFFEGGAPLQDFTKGLVSLASRAGNRHVQ